MICAVLLFLLLLQDECYCYFQHSNRQLVKRLQAKNEVESIIEVLKSATLNRNIERVEVSKSVNKLEKLCSSKVVDAASVFGDWDVVFSSVPGGAENGFVLGGFFNGYFAIQETCSFSIGDFKLRSSLGGFAGPSRISSAKPLVIEYEIKEFKLGFIAAEVPPNLRSYCFIYVDKELAVARCLPSGAAALMKKS